MKYEKIKNLEEEQFQRLTGVKKSTFHKMIDILEKEDAEKKRRGGRKNKLTMEDRLLMTFEYLREYRTYFHISKNYGLCESTTYETIKWVENTLIKYPDFSLLGKRALLKNPVDYEVILIDVTETPIERPKKR